MLIFTLTVLLLVCMAAALQPDAYGIIRIPIHRMESGLQRAIRNEDMFKTIQTLMEHEKKASTSGDNRNGPSNDTLPIFKYFETEYYGLMTVGKPGKQFKMILDTAWGYSWLLSQECPRTEIPCAVHNKYDHKRSSAYKPDGRPFNSSNGYIGYMSRDLFHVGHLNVTDQVFAELTTVPFSWSFYMAEGTLGLAQEGLSPNVLPFFANFYKQNRVQPIFSMYINRDPTTPRGGSLFLGGVDFKHNKTEFDIIPVIGDSNWMVNMDKVSLIMSKKSRQDFCVQGCQAYLDTSANAIVGPDEDIGTINRIIGASPFPVFSHYLPRFLIPCVNVYKGPKVSFSINGKDYTVKAQDYIQKISYSGLTVCLSAFQPSKGVLPPNTWSLGGAFLYQYYTAYDMEKKVVMIADAA